MKLFTWFYTALWNREDTRPEWEKMSDDGMNKFLKFCISVVLLYFAYETVVALIDRFF
tara:strand:+ start:1300 stop:1473 length:174 start_codon:yes stop_codon:yes gene_type:complete